MLAASSSGFAIVFIVFAFVAIIARGQSTARERQQRLRLLEEALRNPANDNVTRQELIRRLSVGSHPVLSVWRDWFWQNFTPARVFGTFAWALVVAGSLTMALGRRWDFEAGIAMLSVGVAVLALPSVMREIDARVAPRRDR